MDIKTKLDVAIITGAGQGIGKQISLKIASLGIPVLCISKSNNVFETAKEIKKAGNTADAIRVDISDFKKLRKLIGEWKSKNRKFKSIGMVLAASIIGEVPNIKNLNIEDWDNVMKVNLFGNLAVFNSFVDRMLKFNFGRVVFFAGGGSAYAYPLFPAYSAAKTAVVRTVENLSELYSDHSNIYFSALAPGAVETNMLKKVKKAGAEIRRTVDISEPVNYAVNFLLSEKCNYSGRFVHVRDNWIDYLNSENTITNNDLWKLRRIEK